MAVATCGRCGKQAEVDDEDTTPLGWTLEFSRERILRYCADCSREHIRAIEGKLSEEYW